MDTSRFLRACRRQPVDTTPVWFMRQAGRYLPAYRAVRARASLLEICADPALVAEVTLQPVEALGVDAAIIFADLLLPVPGLGRSLHFSAGDGPVISPPVRTAADVAQLRQPAPEEFASGVLEGIRLVRRALDGRVPLIGFAGAPFTLASYLIEGGSSRHYLATKHLLTHEPAAWHALMERLTAVTIAYLQAQVAAGVQAVQLFDSWAGALSPFDYQRAALPWTQRIVAALKPLDVPVILFSTGTAGFLPLLAATGADVISVDWRITLADAWAAIGFDRAIQGNLDPAALFAPRDDLARQAQQILDQAAGRPGHIFNLGHGILPDTPVEHVRFLVEYVHEHAAQPSPPLV
jgi:uroporphyrinogen decarboxylase